MAFADFAQTEDELRKLKNPALVEIFLGVHAARRRIEFMNDKDVSRLVDVTIRSPGAFVDNHLILVHELQNLHTRRGSYPCTRTNLVRASLEVSWGQFIYVNSPGYPRKRLVIPSEHLLVQFFPNDQTARDEHSIEIPLEPGNGSCFPFDKYDGRWDLIPIPDPE